MFCGAAVPAAGAGRHCPPQLARPPAGLAAAATLAPPAALSDPLAKPAPAWQPIPARQVEAQAFAWLKARHADAEATAKAAAIWRDVPSPASEDELLVRVARTFALIDANAAKLLAMCSLPRAQLVVPGEPWLRGGGAPPFFANNLRLLFASWLAHESLYDEAKEQLDGLAPADVVAPASLLFYQSVVYHALLNKESGLKSIDAAAARRRAEPAALRRAGPADAGRPRGARGRHARPRRPADGRHPAPAGPWPGRAGGPQGRGRRHRLA